MTLGDQVPTGDRLDPIVARLLSLHPQLIDLSLDRIQALLGAIDHPERRLPPVIHVAGTNGKGSTCAFIRAVAEAAGLRVHVFTSPHLVRFNERIRLAGQLVSDTALADAMETMERANAGAPITVFEIVTATALHLFADTPADLCVLEVGLGGRFDATNVIEQPTTCAITSISRDHTDFLGDTIAKIAFEKAGIIKPGVPVVTGLQSQEAREVIAARAQALGAPLLARGTRWDVTPVDGGMRYEDAYGTLELPLPALLGSHQFDNAGIAIAAVRASALPIPDAAFAGISRASWPARMQRLSGHLAAMLPEHWELWLDGGHNPGAGEVLSAQLENWADRPLHLIVGMKQSKDIKEFLRPLLPLVTGCWAVAEKEQHLALSVEAIIAASGGVAKPGPTVTEALPKISQANTAAGVPGRVLICGTLYLAGEVLKLDGVTDLS